MNTTQTMDAMQAQRLEGSIGSIGGSSTGQSSGALSRLWTMWVGGSRLLAAAPQAETAVPPAGGTGPMSGISEIATHPTRTADRPQSSPSAPDAAAAADAHQGRQTNADAARWGAALLDQLGVSARR